MPSVITHDIFGHDIYDELYLAIGDGTFEKDAFLLGNQGPDVLFFGSLNPLIASSWGLGSKMHRTAANKLLIAFRDAVCALVDDARSVGEAYLLGMVCHYILDSTLHPFVYAQQYEICDAGVDGLSRDDGHEVHAEIESELDILILSKRLGKTIEDFNPSISILRADERTLKIISCLYKRVAYELYDIDIPVDSYTSSVKAYRRILRMIYSPRGIKRGIFGFAEQLVRPYSFIQAMSHKNELIEESIFDNHEGRNWIDPNTYEVRDEGFWDLYSAADKRARDIIPSFMNMSAEEVNGEFASIDFNGAPTIPTIISIE